MMACEIRTVKFAGSPTPMFFCGPRRVRVRKRCRFCGCRDAKALCDWPVRKPTQVPAKDLQVGDAWITKQNKLRGVIVDILKFDVNRQETDDQFVTLQIWVRIPGRSNPYPYMKAAGDLVTSEREGTCDAACCHRHRRHVGPNRDYCEQHWHAWENVA